MPVIEFLLRPVGKSEGIQLKALVDSGADATIIPTHLLQQAGVEQVGRARMRWGPHSVQIYDVYLAVIEIGSETIPGIRVLADAQHEEIVLGRDVLNQLKITLNGPAHVVEVAAM